MVDHIYGRNNVLNATPRPNMFMAELEMVIDYFRGEIKKSLPAPNEIRIKYLNEFKSNLLNGIAYYEKLVPEMTEAGQAYQTAMSEELQAHRTDLEALIAQYPQLS
jgi:hypothetical protein